MRVSYNDYKLYLSILESVSKQLNKAIKSEISSNATEEIPDHDFDGKTKMNIEYHFITILLIVYICANAILASLHFIVLKMVKKSNEAFDFTSPDV